MLLHIPIDKSYPITGRAGQDGSRKLRLPDFLTTAQYCGRLSAQGHGLVGRKYVTEKSSDTTGNRSRDRPASSAAP